MWKHRIQRNIFNSYRNCYGGEQYFNQEMDFSYYLVTSNKKGISSPQLGKHIGISQQSAWFMLHRIRDAKGIKFKSSGMFLGTTEIDELLLRYYLSLQFPHFLTSACQKPSPKYCSQKIY